MNPLPQQTHPNCAELLERLADEERVLREALASLIALFDVLRRGKPAELKDLSSHQENLAAELTRLSEARGLAARSVAEQLGLGDCEITLSMLIERVSESDAASLRSSRERLIEITNQMNSYRDRNANLLHHLRSYFRNVLSAISATDVPVRYGRTGIYLSNPSGSRFLAKG